MLKAEVTVGSPNTPPANWHLCVAELEAWLRKWGVQKTDCRFETVLGSLVGCWSEDGSQVKVWIQAKEH